jgi:two-component system OmpR family sensor kinase
MLGSSILLSGLVAAVASFVLAYAEARELQDDILRQIALLAQQDTGVSTQIGAGRRDRADLAVGDPESRVSVIRLPGSTQAGWLAGDLESGFHTVEKSGERLRVFVQKAPLGTTTVVAQPTDARDEIAMNSALRTLIPLLLLLPVMVWLIVRIVRSELAPVSRLAGHLDRQPADRPRPLSDEGVPDEVIPFVHAINRLLERVRDLMSQQRRFIADAAHELRSPLTALSIQAQNLRQAGTLETMRERVLPLEAGIERARKLTEQLLSLARTQIGTPEKVEVDGSAMARALIADYLPLAEAKGIDMGLEESRPLKLRAAPESLRLVLGNALENALKYVPAGGEITLRLYSDNGCDIIEVVDNGPGIPEPERDRVFNPFYRMPGTTREGSGLGLAIAMEAAASQGATVSLHDRPDGSGLVFRYRQRHDT